MLFARRGLPRPTDGNRRRCHGDRRFPSRSARRARRNRRTPARPFPASGARQAAYRAGVPHARPAGVPCSFGILVVTEHITGHGLDIEAGPLIHVRKPLQHLLKPLLRHIRIDHPDAARRTGQRQQRLVLSGPSNTPYNPASPWHNPSCHALPVGEASNTTLSPVRPAPCF